MDDPASYLVEVEYALVASPVISEYEVLRSWANTDDGYVRIRATLTNGDFLKAAEYFAIEEDRVVTIDYRHQWMDGMRNMLRRRWDNTPHHPEVESHPHHVHLSGEHGTVVRGEPMSLIELLTVIEKELSAGSKSSSAPFETL